MRKIFFFFFSFPPYFLSLHFYIPPTKRTLSAIEPHSFARVALIPFVKTQEKTLVTYAIHRKRISQLMIKTQFKYLYSPIWPSKHPLWYPIHTYSIESIKSKLSQLEMLKITWFKIHKTKWAKVFQHCLESLAYICSKNKRVDHTWLKASSRVREVTCSCHVKNGGVCVRKVNYTYSLATFPIFVHHTLYHTNTICV